MTEKKGKGHLTQLEGYRITTQGSGTGRCERFPGYPGYLNCHLGEVLVLVLGGIIKSCFI